MPRPESDEGLRPVAALTSISSAVTCWEWNGTNVVFAYDSERERQRQSESESDSGSDSESESDSDSERDREKDRVWAETAKALC